MNLDLHYQYLSRVLNSDNLRVYYNPTRGFDIAHETGYITIGKENTVQIPSHGVKDPKFKYGYKTEAQDITEIISRLKDNVHVVVQLSYSQEEYFQLCTTHIYVYPPHISALVDSIFAKANQNEASIKNAIR